MLLDAKGDGGCPHRQCLHLRALSQASGKLLGPSGCELVVLDVQHPEGHHVWKHMRQALGSRVADTVIVQAVGDRGQARGQGCWGVRA